MDHAPLNGALPRILAALGREGDGWTPVDDLFLRFLQMAEYMLPVLALGELASTVAKPCKPIRTYLYRYKSMNAPIVIHQQRVATRRTQFSVRFIKQSHSLLR